MCVYVCACITYQLYQHTVGWVNPFLLEDLFGLHAISQN